MGLDLRHIVLRSCIKKRGLFSKEFKILPPEKQIVKHVIGAYELVKQVEDKFMRQCQDRVYSLNSASWRTKYDEENNMVNQVYECSSFVTMEMPIWTCSGEMMFPIEIYLD